ncbi:MAG: riboflavin kinase / adenylyltransferase [Solirubrobacterales bacterium]|nr:riboflavin kinase / adenylyltransferase [Solirubrobacterales bacterium]
MAGGAQRAGTLVGLADVDARPRRVALGMFDGVHLGHREVMRGATCVLTFDPHPLSVVAPAHAPPLITTLQRRAELIGTLGITEVVVIPFDARFAAYGPQEFVDEILVGALHATHVSVGRNFRFGHRGAGDPALLAADPRFSTRTVPLVAAGGATVSSTAIRSLLALGDVGGAATLLGAPFTIDAGPAAAEGRLVAPPGSSVPAPGRYACRVTASDGTVAAMKIDVEAQLDAAGRALLRAPAIDPRGQGPWRLEFLERTSARAAAA